MNFIGVDTGRKSTKVANGAVVVFPSIVGTARKLRLENHQDYDVVIDGEHLFVGQLAEESLDRREMGQREQVTSGDPGFIPHCIDAGRKWGTCQHHNRHSSSPTYSGE